MLQLRHNSVKCIKVFPKFELVRARPEISLQAKNKPWIFPISPINSVHLNMYIRVFHFYTFVQFRLALCISWLQHSMYATTKNISVLAYVEVPVTGHGVLDGKLH